MRPARSIDSSMTGRTGAEKAAPYPRSRVRQGAAGDVKRFALGTG
jgi:hypothetical protein